MNDEINEKSQPTAARDQGLAWAPAIQHPMDRALLKKIDGLPLLPKLMGWVLDRMTRETEAMLAGDGVMVTEQSLPKAHAAFREACEALDLDPNAFLFFVQGDGSINAYTTGSKQPIVVATSGLVNAFSQKELAFVIGHELGHYICGHCRCHALARFLNSGLHMTGDVAGGLAAVWAFPVWLTTKAVATVIGPLLMSWSRYSELSADRAGYLACKDFESACAAYLKLGGFPHLQKLPDPPSRVLMAQSAEYARLVGRFSMARRFWRETAHALGATHPRTVERFAALDEWNDLGCYDELVDATTEQRLALAKDVGTDYLRNELLLAAVLAAADYAEKSLSVPRRDALRLLRGAFLHGMSLRDSALGSVLHAKIDIAKGDSDSLSYTLQLLVRAGDSVRRASLPLDYSEDWDFAPDGIRAEFVRSRKDAVSILLYEPKA